MVHVLRGAVTGPAAEAISRACLVTSDGATTVEEVEDKKYMKVVRRLLAAGCVPPRWAVGRKSR